VIANKRNTSMTTNKINTSIPRILYTLSKKKLGINEPKFLKKKNTL
jgi:hypothetical protein